MNVTLVCGANANATSKLCAMLGSIGFNGYQPYINIAEDKRFNTFVSAKLEALIDTLGDTPALNADVYALLDQFQSELKAFAEQLKKKRIFLYHPQLYKLIPYLKHIFDIKVIFVLDNLIEPDNQLTEAEWRQYYQTKTVYFSAIAGLIENQKFPYLFISTTDFYENNISVLKQIIDFHQLKANANPETFNALQRDANQLARRVSERAAPLKKLAVVTAYAKESTETLLKCISSVKSQTIACDHILIADGYENEAIAQLDGHELIHITLPENIGFNQCGVGIELAFALGYEVVGILDADNWYEPDHLEISLNTINNKNADVAFAKRKIVFPDGEVLSVRDPQDNTGLFADTNCLVLTNKVAALTPIWLMWPKEFGAGEDRAVSICTRLLNFSVSMNPHETVWYQTNWAHHYKLQNKKPVAPLRKPSNELARSFEPNTFFAATGLNLPIKNEENLSTSNTIDFLKLSMVVSNVTNSVTLKNLEKFNGKCRVLATHSNDIMSVDLAGVQLLKLLPHSNFNYTSWTIGASLMFQTGADVVLLIDDPKHLDEVKFGAMLNLAKVNNADVVLQSTMADNVPVINTVLVTKGAKFFAAIWNQLTHIPAEYRLAACENHLSQKNIKFIHLKN